MIFLESLLIALSTYSIVPVPQFEWNDRNMKYALCFLPVVGILCGALLFGWSKLACVLGVSDFFFAAIAVCIPVVVTGGIHVDGYMDTVDALASNQPNERKLEILKDPSCGAFAVIYCIVYFVVNLAIVYELYVAGSVVLLCPVFVLSRALSALCAVNMQKARKSGMLTAYTEKTEKKTVTATMVVVVVIASLATIAIQPFAGSITVCCGIVSTILYCKMVKKQFGGVTGDTAGFFLQVCELFCMIGALLGVLIK